MTDDKNRPEESAGNEGEGSRTAARDYNERKKRFVDSGQVEERARDAERALDGPQTDELKDAEEAGRGRSRGVDPSVKRPWRRTACFPSR